MRMGEGAPTPEQPNTNRVLAAVERTSMKAPVLLELPEGSLGYMTIQSNHETRQRPNEDMVFVIKTPKSLWIVVGDGIGSLAHTPEAITIFIKTLEQVLPTSDDFTEVLKEAQIRFDREIPEYYLPKNKGDRKKAGGGLVVGAVKIEERKGLDTPATLYELGDIGILEIGDEPDDTIYTTQAQHTSEHHNVLTARISASTQIEDVLKDLQTIPTTIEENDIIILCSDGVTEFLSAEIIVSTVQETLKQGQNPAQAAQLVCQLAIAQGSYDDLTCAVYVQK